jgi:putative ABC transport system substrate-binding protein
MLMSGREGDESALRRIAVFQQAMRDRGWVDGRNVLYEARWGGGQRDGVDEAARVIAALAPEVALTVGTPATDSLRRRAPKLPIVFAVVADPVGDGFVASLSHPGGYVTGFATFDAEFVGKWLSLLKESVPRISRCALLFNPRTAPFSHSAFQRPLFFEAARQLALEPSMLPVHDEEQMRSAVGAFARGAGGSIVVMPDAFMIAHRAALFELAATHALPVMYPFGTFAADGGLIAYGVEMNDLHRRAAPYVDRILKGARPADLPVQAPTKFELVVNLKTARSQGLTIPQSILLRADRVIG